MERVGKTLKKQSFRKVIIYFLTWCMVFNTSLPIVWAEVILDSNVQGTITVSPLGGGITQDMTATDGAIGHFSDFDIASGHVVDCVQPSNDASALFRVISGGATDILGTFNANGNIYLINPAGILFGVDSQVNVNRLVASGLDMSNAAFDAVLNKASNKMVFSGGSGNVTNNGTINAAESAYLIGRNVTNNGSILCPNGLVVMAAGNAIQLGQPGSNVIVTLADLGDAGGDNVVTNNGTVGEDGSPVGKLVLAAGDVWSQAISNVKKVEIAVTGSIEADDLDSIYAYSDGGSDAVATIDIKAGEDVTIDDNVTAYTSVNIGLPGDPENDAKSTIDIHADGSGNAESTVTIDADASVNINSHVEAYAKAKYGSGDALATVNLTADETVNVDDSVVAYARTQYDGGNSTALVDIDADYVDISGSVEAQATVKNNSGNAKADVMLYGVEDVDIVGGEGDALVKSWARTSYDSGNATSKTTVETPGSVNIGDGSIEAWAVTEDNSYSEGTGPNLDATVDIDAGEEIIVGYDGDLGHILAVAKTGESAYGNVGTITSTVVRACRR